MAKEVVIRYYSKDDLPAAKALISLYSPHSSDDIDNAKDHDSTTANHIWVAEIRGKIVGTMLAVRRGSLAEISLILVDEPYREKGVGRELILALAQFVEKSSLRKIYCTVAPRNTAALAFFDCLGFVREGGPNQHRKGRSNVIYVWYPGKEIPITSDVLIREMEDNNAEVNK